jgi:RHS repeat-associated protein
MRLTLRFNHRGESLTNSIGGFGPKWSCNWVGLLDDGGTGKMTNHLAGGGVAVFRNDGTPEYRTARVLIPALAPQLVGPTAALNQYGQKSLMFGGRTTYFLTQRMDRYSRATQFTYETNSNWVRLTNVVDSDSNASKLTYTNNTLISSVTDPYGRTAHFYYDSSNRLAQIVDTMQMSSSFQYDSSNRISQMTTPYGITYFEYFPETNGYPHRVVRITEPNGQKQLFAYCPTNTPGVSDASVFAGSDDATVRNSFHWNRAQYDAISQAGQTDPLNNMSDADYLLAETRHWLIGTDEATGLQSVTDTLDAKGSAADANGNRVVEAFEYEGQTGALVGNLRRISDHWTAVGQTISITRNELGRATNIVYFNSDGKTCSYTNTFDGSGRYLQRIDGQQGELVRGYGYDSAITNLLVSVTNAVGDVIRYTHVTNNNLLRVTSVTFPTLLVRSNFYTSGFLNDTIDVGFRTNLFTYENGNEKTHTDELGLAVTNSYDALNRLTNVSFPDGTSVAYTYSNLDIIAVKDRLGHTNRYVYNNVRQLVAVTNANGAVTEFTYCGCGSPSTVKRWNGTTALTDSYFYDMAGRLTNATYADGYQLNYTYNSAGLVASVIDTSGLELDLSYMQIGQIYKISTATLASQQIVYNQFDNYGRLQSTLDRNGITVTNAYDLLDRLVTRVTLDQTLTPYATNTYTYTSRGLTNMVDALNHATWFVRDPAERLLFQTNANNEVLQFTYNPADEMLSLTDGKNQTTRWNYDEYGRTTNKLDQANVEILRYSYDPESRLTNRWSAAKGNTKYAYDSIGNLLTINYPLSGTINYSYDSLNRLTNMVDAVGTTLFTYSGSGQLLTEDGPFANDTITNVYWSRMRTNISLAQPTGVWTNAFVYSSTHRLYSVTSPAGTSTYNYAEPSTRLTSLSLPNGAYVNNVYDTMSRLTNSFLYGSGPLDGHLYQYDRENQRTNEVRADNSTVAYSYDKIGQLTVATSSVPAESSGYTYDTAWNLNWRTNNGVASQFKVNVLNELTNAPVGATLSYDSNGNLLAYQTGHDNNAYAYDDENRLVDWQDGPTGLETVLSYDGLGRLRVRQEYQNLGSSPLATGTLVSETHYIYDGMRVIQERDGANAPTVSYTRGNDLSVSLEGAAGIGGLLARSSGYSSGNWTSHADYFADRGGNVTSLTDGNQAVVASYRYDPFGNTISKSGTLADANVYRYSSKEAHVNSGMYYYGFRFYDPNLQRWINRDPIGEVGGINLFGFAENDPPNEVDPFGLTLTTNWKFFSDWVTGGGQANRYYGPNAIETQEMENSPGANMLRDQFYNGGCNDLSGRGYGTREAAMDTLVNPRTANWGGTAAQVGGFGGAGVTNNHDGTVTFTIPNKAGTKSFFYHAVPDRASLTGPMRTINQTFQWTEPIDPARCPSTQNPYQVHQIP